MAGLQRRASSLAAALLLRLQDERVLRFRDLAQGLMSFLGLVGSLIDFVQRVEGARQSFVIVLNDLLQSCYVYCVPFAPMYLSMRRRRGNVIHHQLFRLLLLHLSRFSAAVRRDLIGARHFDRVVPHRVYVSLR